MDVPLEYLEQLARNSDSSTLTEYLDFCTESKLFCLKNNEKDVTSSVVNSLLCSKDTSSEGMVILDSYIEQCPRESMSVNILSWVQQAAKYLVDPENGSLSIPAFSVLGKLLEIAAQFPEAKKQIALNVIYKILDHFVRESNGTSQDLIILQCLEKTLRTFGKSCAFHKESITKIIFTHLKSDPDCVYVAGRCYLQLATCGGPGVDGDNYVAAWQHQQMFLLNSLHERLDYLFANITESQDYHRRYKLDGSLPVIPKVEIHTLVRKKQVLTKQFQSLAQFLKILLCGPFQYRRQCYFESVLGLVWRGLAINYRTLSVGPVTSDASSLAVVITQVNIACLDILNALIKSCRLLLVTHSSEISRILKQALKWTVIEKWPFGVTRPLSSLRVKIYECLCDWLAVSRATSGIDENLDEIIEIVVSDINHDPPAVTLKVPKGKGKKKLATQKATGEPLQFLVNPEMNSQSCEAALTFVSELLNTSSTLMKASQHKALQECIINKLICIQQRKQPIPYSKEFCRLALYRALFDLCQNCHHAFQPPVNYATVLFSGGIKDTSLEVSRFCLFALRSIEKILRPVCPTLEFPVSEDSVEKLNISKTQDESILLNSLEYQRLNKRKRGKRNSQTPNYVEENSKRSKQITSTPEPGSLNQRAFITPGFITPMRSDGFQNLSDFESGANFSMTNEQDDKESSKLEQSTKNDSLQSKQDNTSRESGGDDHGEANFPRENVDAAACPVTVTTNPPQHDNNQNGDIFSNPYEINEIYEEHESRRESLNQANDNSLNGDDLSPSNKENKSKSSKNDMESDDEMLSSFVDEVSEHN